ncbi:hypothetical protein FBU59_004014 [Linderina macrospora]|uniref:Uncharacterized protein n=1 Tax=Linderina macrospora TaxID=4868 RepID=A0ACC1J6W2_9FUNG|nr:hypothetical protein FBU59_004014 [Linderina macrospora]
MQDRRNTFELIAPTRTYLLQAENEHDLGAWTACLRQAIEASLYAHMPAQMQPAASTPSAAQSQANSASNTPALMQLDSFSVSRASSTQRSDNDNEAQRARIKALRAVAGNESCVDCGRRAPEWAAINLGALMCIECSGVHRSLGVHVSKVRSVKLDNWEPELLQIMLRLGNRAVNQIYEAVPPHPGDPAKPEPRMPRDQAAPFLSAKYASRVWVCPGETTEEKPTAGLFGAVRSGNLEAALTALAQGADVNAHDELSGSTPLIAAARTGDFGMLELLLLWGADINARGRMTATAYTTDSPHVDHAKQEATAKSEIIVGGGTALHLAARLGNVHMVWYLIRKGAQWDTPDAYGLLPLDIALEDSDVQVVMALRYAAFQKASGLPPGTLGSTRARHYTQGNAEQVDMLEMDDSLIQGWAIPPYVPKAERLSGEFTEFVDSSTTADAAFDEPLDSSENQMVSGTAALSISPPPPPRVSVSTNPTQPAQQNEP